MFAPPTVAAPLGKVKGTVGLKGFELGSLFPVMGSAWLPIM